MDPNPADLIEYFSNNYNAIIYIGPFVLLIAFFIAWLVLYTVVIALYIAVLNACYIFWFIASGLARCWGHRNSGTTQETPERPKSGIKRLLLVTHGSDDGDCVICLEEFQQGEARWALAACNHSFHRNCITRWLEKNGMCPICRKSSNPNTRRWSQS